MRTIWLLIAYMLTCFPSHADSEESSIARGGRLYDKWFTENRSVRPKIAHPSYPDSGKYKGNKGNDWRCKECHGWDYQGKGGAYSNGKHYTGIKGITHFKKNPVGEVQAVLQDRTHAYGQQLSQQDLADLSLFIISGQINMDAYIDRDTRIAKGDIGKC